MFTCGHPGDAAKFNRTIKKIKNYVVRHYGGGLNLAKGILDGTLPSIELPPQPIKTEVEARGEDHKIAVFIWKAKAKDILAEQKYMETGNKFLFSLFQDQCSPKVTTKMEGLVGYK